MGNLIRMDLYRMRKSKSFWVYLILAFVLAFIQTPLARLMVSLSTVMGIEAPAFPAAADLGKIIADPFGLVNALLIMLSVCGFYYADMEAGYIKNIAGQTPRKGYAIMSRFLASILHSVIFMLVGGVGCLLGTIPFQRIVADAGVMDGIVVFLLKLLLLQSICSMLLLTTASFRNKSLGMILAVLMGMGLLSLIYMGIDSGLNQLFHNKGFQIADYMPDQLLGKQRPDTLTSLIVSGVTLFLFLTLSLRVFDRKEVK